MSRFLTPPRERFLRSLTQRSTTFLLAATIALTFFALQAEPAQAQCPDGALCGLSGQDVTRSSSVIVTHVSPDPPPAVSVTPVQPDTGEVLSITASYRLNDTTPTGCICDVRTTAVSVAVDWTGSNWSAVCTGCGGGSPILGVTICPVDGCGDGPSIDYSWIYELVVDLNTRNNFNCSGMNHLGSLIAVDYETTAIDDGDTIRTANCSLLAAVTPTSQVFSASDTGPFECGYSCADTTGTSMTITYQ